MKVLLVLLFLFSMPVLACLQTTETDIDGNAVTIEVDFRDELTARSRAASDRWAAYASELAGKVKADPGNREYHNDYGVALARTGRVREALQLFRAMEAELPGQYKTAANLGTVLELSGNDEEALQWIQEAIRRNPKSHRGTEWVHVRILEAKLAHAKDPSWLKTHTIIGTDFGNGGRPVASGRLRDKVEMGRVAADLKYQLRERMSLVSPPDIYVGDLLFQLGNMDTLTRSVERGRSDLEVSVVYGTSRPELLQTRLKYLRSVLPGKSDKMPKKVDKAKKDATATRTAKPTLDRTLSPLVIAPIAIILSLLFWQRRRRKRRAN